MPVRVYDIAKKFGIESKAVIAKAKELGITAAKVASSSIDKISAEELERHLGDVPVVVEPPPKPIEHTPILIVAPPEPPPAPAPVIEAQPEIVPPTTSVVETLAAPVAPAVPAVPPASVIPPPPAVPTLGQKVGFIQLAPRPPRPGERPPAGRPPVVGRPPLGGAPDRRDAPRDQRFGGNRPALGATAPKTVTPAAQRFVGPTSGELITMKPPVIVRELAERLKRKPFQLIADLMELGVFANVNQAVDETIAQRLCAKHGFRFETEKRERGGGQVHAAVKKIELDDQDKPEHLKSRPPIVTIMGHVDHGKTSLLDVIRKANVAAGEAGGITQHIGAYTISFPHPERKNETQQITFLDTPGHAAFSAMRARGANVTDIVVLVVAANDGVMPQTLEALSHAQAAKTEIIVAVNKCDHPNANPMKVRQQLQEKGLVCEEWGGKTIFVDCSAITKVGVDKLLESILLQAEVMELKANPDRRAKGNVIESGLLQGGPTATVLVRKGTLKVGEVILCDQFYGKVRALIDEEGKRLKEAGPSVAVRVLGLNGVPEAGHEFTIVENEKSARDVAEERGFEAKALAEEERRPKVTLENLFASINAEQAKTLRIVVKADTQGSVEAIVEALRKIDASKVTLDIIHHAVGTVTESDILLASASKAIALGFHTRIDTGVSDSAKHHGVQIKLYAIIYELIDEVKLAMAGLLDPILKEVVTGTAEIRQLFSLSKGGNVAGCYINSGRIARGKVRVLRRKGLIYEGVTLSLRRFQDEVNEVRSGMECGIRLDGFNDFEVGDTIECYSIEKVAQQL